MKHPTLMTGLCAAGLLAGTSTALITGEVTAADHAEAPATMMDPEADILDFYAWHNGESIIAVLTYSPFIDGGGDPVYDAEVVYGIHIDNTYDEMAGEFDNVPDHNIWVRFGQNAEGDWGVQFENLPGVADPVSGPVGAPIDVGPNGQMGWAGLADDPFFFDVEGYTETLASSTLSFDNTRDGFAGFNVMAIVVQIDQAEAAGDSSNVQTWVTTRRVQ